jgi:hypothetical protein
MYWSGDDMMQFIKNKLTTIGQLFKFFMVPKRVIFIPMLVVLMLVCVLLFFAKGLSAVAPFMYTLL